MNNIKNYISLKGLIWALLFSLYLVWTYFIISWWIFSTGDWAWNWMNLLHLINWNYNEYSWIFAKPVLTHYIYWSLATLIGSKSMFLLIWTFSIFLGANIFFVFKKILSNNWIFFVFVILFFGNPYSRSYIVEWEKSMWVIYLFVLSIYCFLNTSKKYNILWIFFISLLPLVHSTWLLFFGVWILQCIFISIYKKKSWQSILKSISVIILFWSIFFWSYRYWLHKYSQEQYQWVDTEQYNRDLLFSRNFIQEIIGNDIDNEFAALIKIYIDWHYYWMWFANFVDGINRYFPIQFKLLLLASIVFLLLFKSLNKNKSVIAFILLSTSVVLFIWLWSKRASFSHFSRYPFYIVFFIFAFVSLVIGAARISDQSKMLITFLIMSITYTSTYWIKGSMSNRLNNIFNINYEMWLYIDQNIKLDEKNKVLVMWRPQTYLGILENDYQKWIDKKRYFYNYWFETDKASYENLTLDHLKEIWISYFVYTNSWWDTYNSNQILRNKLYNNLEMIKRMQGYSTNKEVILYKLK